MNLNLTLKTKYNNGMSKGLTIIWCRDELPVIIY